MSAILRRTPTPSNAEQSERRVTLRSPFGRSEFSCRSGEPILYAGLRHGLNLPYECATGTCGVCRLVGAPSDVRLIWTEAPGRSRLKADRELLLCQSVARRDCEIESNVPLPPWPAGRPRPDYYQGRVTSRRLLARDVLAFTIALERPMAFEPGQFALLRAPEFAGYRTYSMINTDAPARELSFVIKRKVGGAASGWLFESAGDRPAVELFGPLGRAVLGADEDANLLIIAGGTGIAGPLAILRGAAARNLFSTRRAVVLFGVRTVADAFFLEPLADLADRWPKRVAVTLALSDEPAPTERHRSFPAIALASGTIDAVLRRHITGPCPDTIAFVGGPPPMIHAAVHSLVRSVRFPANRIRYDRSW